MKKITAFYAVLLLFFSGVVFSATWENAKGIGVSYSAIKPKGGNIDRAALGTMLGGNLKYGLSPYTMLSLDMSTGSFKPNQEGSSFKPDGDASYETSLIPIQLSLRVNPFADSRVKPYVLFGTGLIFWDLKDNGNSVHGKQTDFSLAIGLGLEWFITESLGLDFLVRSSSYINLDKDNVGYGDDINRELVESRVTLNYYWGQNRDRDKDGIPDKLDAAVLAAEDFDGFQDHDGAPDLDNDNDGILDVDDQAPLKPEDKDGFQDQDGVPDPDNDNDGILDVDDQAPLEPEDKDGFQDEDGIPDLDNDNDGIADADDKCPNEAETVNGFQDEDGCPDVKPLTVLKAAGTALVLKGVTFKTGSAELTSESSATLDKAIDGLKDHPKVEIEIRGYTDNVGRAASNQKLSEKRAQSVRQYLIDNGIDTTRLTAVGLGEKNPVASNATPEGRAQNRRIEFYRTK